MPTTNKISTAAALNVPTQQAESTISYELIHECLLGPAWYVPIRRSRHNADVPQSPQKHSAMAGRTHVCPSYNKLRLMTLMILKFYLIQSFAKCIHMLLLLQDASKSNKKVSSSKFYSKLRVDFPRS